MENRSIKLNLGSGDKQIAGYINLDIKNGHEIFPLYDGYDFGDHAVAIHKGQIDEIRASHILEHFPHGQTLAVLKDWIAALKPGGILKIAVPDFGKLAKNYTNGEKLNFLGYIMGGQIDQNDYHKSLFDEPSLRQLMESVGLIDIRPWQSEIADCASLPISLNLMGTVPTAEQKQQDIRNKEIKIVAVTSKPRLTFSANSSCILRALVPLGIKVEDGTGVFWGQVLTRMIEKHMDEAEFILTIDYDTFFTTNHVWKLCQLMMENPDIDAIVPLQVSRENDFCLFGRRDDKGNPVSESPRQLFKQDLMPIATGHFGLTLFRVSSLLKLKKPWFKAIPDPNGSWHEGRQDEDIYFWNNAAACGWNIQMAPTTPIGHIQLMCTFPGRPEDDLKPVHCYMNDILDGKIPEWCVPKIETAK